MPKTKLTQFRSTEAEHRRLKHAAKAEGLTLSEWLRRLALLRVAELGDRLDRVSGD